ncbi:MAG: Rossmann-like fold-containing protein [Enhygromyxa sp.]
MSPTRARGEQTEAAEEAEATQMAEAALAGPLLAGSAAGEDPPHHDRLPPGGKRGRPLAPGLRGFMEGRFGHDFGDVRIHTAAAGARRTAPFGTAALAYGNDLYFGPAQYRPHSPGGRRMLAHELAHVVQQRTSGWAHVAAWPGAWELEPLQRARLAIRQEIERILRASLVADEVPDLGAQLQAYVDQNHGAEPSEDELEAMATAVRLVASMEARIISGPDSADVLDPITALQLLAWLLGQPYEILEVLPGDQTSFGTAAFLRWLVEGMTDMVVAPLGGPERDFAAEFDAVISSWDDPRALLGLELEATIDELILLRGDFNNASDAGTRSIFGQAVGVAARRALLLNRAMLELDQQDGEDLGPDQPDPLTAAINGAMPRIEAIRRDALHEADTLTQLGDRPSALTSQDVELDDIYLHDFPAETAVTPDEAFPLYSDAAVEQFTSSLASRVSDQATDVQRAREAILHTSPSYDFAEFAQIYRYWFQFYSPRGRDQDPMFQMVDQAVGGFVQISLMADEGALLHLILMDSWASLVASTIGDAQTDFSSQMPGVRRRQRLRGGAQDVQYEFAELFQGSRASSLSSAGERVSRHRVLAREREATRQRTQGASDGWTYLITTEHYDGTSTSERRILDPQIADYLLVRRQQLATLESSHLVGVGDVATGTGGVEAGRGTGEQRYLAGEASDTTNPTVESRHARVRRAARSAGAGERDEPGSRSTATDVTRIFINELEAYLDAYFGEQADVAHRIVGILYISDAEYGSFAHVRNALTPEAIAQSLGIVFGVKILQRAITKLASRAVARSILSGLDRALTLWGGSDISRMVQLAVWLERASGVTTLHQARVWAYFGQFAADALGNLLQSLVVSTTISAGGAGLRAFSHYRSTTSPRTVRELSNTLAPVLADPVAREGMLDALRHEIVDAEARTPDGQSDPDLVALRTLELELMGMSGQHDAADVTLAHDTRSVQERVTDSLEAAGVPAAQRARIEDAAARLPDEPALIREGAASREVADPVSTAALGVEGVPAVRDSTWDGRGVQVVYTTRELLGVTIVDTVHARAGREATVADIALHARTVRHLQRLQGVGGMCRRLWGRVSSVWDGLPAEVKRPGTLGFEAHAEIQKLPAIISRRQTELADYNRAHPRGEFPDARSEALAQEIRSLEGQLGYYETVVRDMEAIAAGGRGWIAALPSDARTLAPGTIAGGRVGRRRRRTLLLGEGDFSFTHALVRQLGGGEGIVASSYDSRAQVEAKYHGRQSNEVRPAAEYIAEASARQESSRPGATIMHEVDATRLRATLGGREGPYDVIVFNYPYVPEASRGGAARTKAMLDQFFANADQVLAPGGRIYLTLAGDYHVSRYRPTERAAGWRLVEVQRFDPAQFSGYRHQRTEREGSASSTEGAHGMTFVFERQ